MFYRKFFEVGGDGTLSGRAAYTCCCVALPKDGEAMSWREERNFEPDREIAADPDVTRLLVEAHSVGFVLLSTDRPATRCV